MKKTATLLFGCIFLCTGWIQYASANDYNNQDPNDPVKKLLIKYIDKMNALTQSSRKEDVLQLFDEKYRGNTVYVNLSGALIRKNYEKKDISSQLDDIIDDNNYCLLYTSPSPRDA